MRFALSVLSFLALAAPGRAQEVAHPADWRVVTDRPQQDPSEVSLVDMPPGWHITTGPAAILFDPSMVAAGEYRVEAEFLLFDPEGRREGFGVFFGGVGLETESRHYSYFLLREGGDWLLKKRSGAETPTIRPWSGHPAIASWGGRPDGSETAKNVLAVEVGYQDIIFFVNDQEVARAPRSELYVEGVAGLRMNHALNLHVTRLELKRRGG